MASTGRGLDAARNDVPGFEGMRSCPRMITFDAAVGLLRSPRPGRGCRRRAGASGDPVEGQGGKKRGLSLCLDDRSGSRKEGAARTADVIVRLCTPPRLCPPFARPLTTTETPSGRSSAALWPRAPRTPIRPIRPAPRRFGCGGRPRRRAGYFDFPHRYSRPSRARTTALYVPSSCRTERTSTLIFPNRL